jgi:uncharacterized membrane protein YhhN
VFGNDTNVALIALTAVSALLCIGGHYASRPVLVYVFKPLTMVWVLALAAQSSGATPAFYTALVVVALLFSLAGDVFLMLPSDRFIPGLASFLVAHIFYLLAFAVDGGAEGPLLSLLPVGVLGGLMYAWLRPGLGRMRVPVACYVLAIVAMAGFALARWLDAPSAGTQLAWVGAGLFVVSDAVLAANRFRTPFPAAQAVVLSTYFAGQCLIALSTGVGQALIEGA